MKHLALLTLAFLAFCSAPEARQENAPLSERLASEVKIQHAQLQAAGDASNALQEAADAPDADEGKQADADAAEEDLQAKGSAFDELLEEWAGAGGDTSTERGFLAEITGNPTYMDSGALLGLVDKWRLKAQDWLVEEAPGLAINLIIFLVIILLFKFIGAIAARITKRVVTSSKLKFPRLLSDFVVNIVRKGTFLMGVVVALPYLGFNIGPILAGLGVFGFVIGFALQDTMGHFAAGIMLLIYRPFDVGDVVTAGGVTGTINALTLVSTTFLTPDNQKHVVPNGSIWGGVITNITANKTRRVDLVMGIGYDDDMAKAEKIMDTVIRNHELIHSDPDWVIKVHELADSSVNFVVRVWCDTSDYWAVYWDLTRGFKEAFDQAGISIPYPQQDVHMHQSKEA